MNQEIIAKNLATVQMHFDAEKAGNWEKIKEMYTDDIKWERACVNQFVEGIPSINDAVTSYLNEKREVWILIDNLDKGWPVHGATREDILIIRTLLEAARKLQRQLEKGDVNFHCLIFLRNDIYEHLVIETPDKGKDTAITLDWPDPEFFKEIFRCRMIASGQLEGSFDEVWSPVFETTIGNKDTFSYIIERTLMRPRDFLNLIFRGIETAINRGHKKVEEDDIIKAEELYSEDTLKTLAYELKDVYDGIPDFLYTFLGSKTNLTKDEVMSLLSQAGIDVKETESAINLLCWYGFLGVQKNGTTDTKYSFQIRYDMPKLLHPIKKDNAHFVIHPAFRSALECEPV
jgi:hypothetical protein